MAPVFDNLGTILSDWSAFWPGHFNPIQRALYTLCIEGLVGPRTILDFHKKKPHPCKE